MKHKNYIPLNKLVSLNESQLMGIEKISLDAHFNHFVSEVARELRLFKKQNKRSVEAIARRFDIHDKTEIKELTELAIVNVARDFANGQGFVKTKYENIVKLYNNQVILSHRTSQSILLQQYSTPAPIAYMMGVFCGLPYLQPGQLAFEPSAGNGLLTIAGQPFRFYVNEVDYTRNRNLQVQSYLQVTNTDATQPFKEYEKKFQAILTNPPFGVLNKAVDYNGYQIKVLDHLMALRALDTMHDGGKAAIIIGGHTTYDTLGRVQAGKNRILFNYLHHHYNVLDVIPIDGHRLYTRQGTGFSVRLILIDGRKEKPSGVAPVKNEITSKVVKSFEDLYARINQWVDEPHTTKKIMTDISALEREARALASLFTDEELGMPYTPASNACVVLNTQVPDSMGFETHAAMARIKAEVGGNIDNFVRHRLLLRRFRLI